MPSAVDMSDTALMKWRKVNEGTQMREVIPSVLWIGNAHDAREIKGIIDAGIQVVIGLAIEEPSVQVPRDIIYCRFPMLDGDGNSSVLMVAAVNLISAFVRAQTPTLVACSGGMSRSPLIASAVLAAVDDIGLAEAIRLVTTNGPCDFSPSLYNDLRQLFECN